MKKIIILLLFLVLATSASAIDCGFKTENMEKVLIPLDKDLICDGTAISFNNISGGVLDCNNFEIKGDVIIKNSEDFEIINCDLNNNQLIITNLNNSEKKVSQEILLDLNKTNDDLVSVDLVNDEQLNISNTSTQNPVNNPSNESFKNAYEYELIIFSVLLLIILLLIFLFSKKSFKNSKSKQ